MRNALRPLNAGTSRSGTPVFSSQKLLTGFVRPVLTAALISSGVMLSTQSVDAQNTGRNRANNETGPVQLTGRNSGDTRRGFTTIGNNTFEFFIVRQDAESTTAQDPRSERGLEPGSGSGVMFGRSGGASATTYFRMDVEINSCHNTGIYQLLNVDSSQSDSNRPYLLIEADRPRSDGGWDIEVIARNGDRRIVAVRDGVFTLSVRTNNRRGEVEIRQNRSRVARFTMNFEEAEYRNRNGISRVRYGAYHHGPQVTDADIRIRNARVVAIPQQFTHLRNRRTGDYLLTSGTSLRSDDSKSGNSRDFRFRHDNGNFRILDDDGRAITTSGNSVRLDTDRGANSRRFQAILISNKYYRFKSRANDRYLGLDSNGNLTTFSSPSTATDWQIEN